MKSIFPYHNKHTLHLPFKLTDAAMILLLFILIFNLSRQAAILTSGSSVGHTTVSHNQSPINSSAATRPVVVLDSGHGGNDPGKVSIDGSLEKDINLQIAFRVKQYLEASDVDVIMTRESDVGLYNTSDSNKKMADMNARCQLINDAAPSLVVSIHQNSYHEESIHGAQVFYYKTSVNGKRLAEILQKRFDYVLGDSNTRSAKANDSYYLLLHVKEPIVIVECGFLSNWNEAALLNTEEYQDRVAWTIHMGIMEYLNTQKYE